MNLLFYPSQCPLWRRELFMIPEHKKMIKNVFVEIGLGNGQKILDFGCGRGYYTIPAAEVVGEEGIVYAVDKNQRKLEELKRKAERFGLENIKVLNSTGGTSLQFEDKSLDVVLLYDIFWYFDLHSTGLDSLLLEVCRILTASGLLSVYPKHVDLAKLESKIIHSCFRLRDTYREMLLHEGQLERGVLLNFIKDS